jgi:hypothetical protein
MNLDAARTLSIVDGEKSFERVVGKVFPDLRHPR